MEGQREGKDSEQRICAECRHTAACERATYRELARLVVNADVGDMHGIRRRGNRRSSRRAHEIAHEAGERALFLAAARMPLLCCVALIAVPVASRTLAARRRGIHLPGKCGEGGGLAKCGIFVFGWLIGVVGIGMLWG